MVDEEQDPFASVFDNCTYASSQDELFTQVEFLHEGEKIPNNVNSPDMEDAGASCQEFDGTDEIERIHGGESTAADAVSPRANNLGFAGERQLEEYCGEESEEEPELKNHKVSPSVHCSGKKVIENEEIVVVSDEGEIGVPKKKIPDDVESPDMEDSGASCQELDGTDEIERVHGGESTTVQADSARAKNLGFAGERQLEEYCGEESEEEPELKKRKVSPLVHCSGEKVNEDGEIVVVPDEGEMRRPKKKIHENVNSPDMEDSRASCQELDGTDEIERIHGGESTAVGADSTRVNNLGFAGERQLEGYCGEGSEEEPELKASPSVHCSGEKVIEDEEIVDVLDEGEMRGPKKKLEFGGDTEVISVEEEQEKKEEVEFGGVTEVINVEEEQEQKEEVEFGGGTEVIGVQEDEIARRKKRELPLSMFGLVWNVGSEYAKGDVGDGLKAANVEGDNQEVVADRLVESGLKEANVEGNRDCISKDGEQETIKCILEAFRLLVNGKFSNGDDDVDVLETARRCGITFPRSRFLPEIEEDEKVEL